MHPSDDENDVGEGVGEAASPRATSPAQADGEMQSELEVMGGGELCREAALGVSLRRAGSSRSLCQRPPQGLPGEKKVKFEGFTLHVF